MAADILQESLTAVLDTLVTGWSVICIIRLKTG
jgi:hypothetical protein